MACGSEGYSLCVSEHSSDANADPANIIIISTWLANDQFHCANTQFKQSLPLQYPNFPIVQITGGTL